MTCSYLTSSLKLEMEYRVDFVDLIFRRESNFYQSSFVRSLIIMTMKVPKYLRLRKRLTTSVSKHM